MHERRSANAIYASVNESERSREVLEWNIGDVVVRRVVPPSRRAEAGMVIRIAAEVVGQASLEGEDSSREVEAPSSIAGVVGLRVGTE